MTSLSLQPARARGVSSQPVHSVGPRGIREKFLVWPPSSAVGRVDPNMEAIGRVDPNTLTSDGTRL